MIMMRDLCDQIGSSVSANGSELAEGIDIDAIAKEICDRYGLVDIDSIPSDEYWAIVERHDATRQEAD